MTTGDAQVRHTLPPGEEELAELKQEDYLRLLHFAKARLGGLIDHHDGDPEDLVHRVLERACRTFDPRKGGYLPFLYGSIKYEAEGARSRYQKEAATRIPLDRFDDPVGESDPQPPVSKATRDLWDERNRQPGPEDQAMGEDAHFDPSDTFEECTRALRPHVAGYLAALDNDDPDLATVLRGLIDDLPRRTIAARLGVKDSNITNAFKRIERGLVAHILAGELAAGGAFIRGLWGAIGADPDDLPVPGGWRDLARIWVGLCHRRTLEAIAAGLALAPAAVRRARTPLQLACKALPTYVTKRES